LNKPTLSRPPFASSTGSLAKTVPSQPGAILLLDAAGKVTGSNSAARHLWQMNDDELIGEFFPRLIQFEIVSSEPDWAQAQWEVLLESTLDQSAAVTAQPRDGSPVDVLMRLEKLPGAEQGYLATAQVPSHTPAAPAATAVSKTAGIELLAQRGNVGFFDLQLKEGVFHFSPAWKSVLGYENQELPDTLSMWHALIHPDDTAAAPDKVGKKSSVGVRTFDVEFRMRHRDGQYLWVECVGVQVLDVAGELERVTGIQLDISERKKLEEESLANETRLLDLSTNALLGAFELDFAGQQFWLSPAWKKMLGYEDAEIANDPAGFALALPAELTAREPEPWLRSFSPGKTESVECVHLSGKGGTVVPVLLGLRRTFNRKKEITRVVGFACPLPENFVTPGANGMVAPALTHQAFDLLGEAVLIADEHGKVVFANAAALRLLQAPREQVLGRAATKVFCLVNRESGRAGDDACERALSADQPLPLISDDALQPLTENGAPLPVVWTARAAFGSDGKPTGIIFVFRNPEEMTLTPEELVRANRFESLGVLAGGIAHDFNNLLATILGGVSMAKDTRDYTLLNDVEKACLNAKGLAKQLLAVAKGGSITQTALPMEDVLHDCVKIAGAGSAAALTLGVEEGTAAVLADRAQISQVFQNLIINALQAMPPPPHSARVDVLARNVALADGQVPPLPAGDYVEVEVRDNGTGIKPEHREKIFDAFFTTKKHGTGLGLATVISIVRKHGGQIGLDSTVGVGTVFTVYLPRADQPAEVQAKKAPSLRFGTGRVLFMDDDPNITALTGTMLESLDYKYDLAKNGEEAIALYQRYLNIGRPYDAVIMDITVIGGMGGEQAFQALRELDPDVRAIVSSGYDNDDMARRFLDMGFCGYLTKPYRVIDLGKMLKAVLG
jgi:two-component system, cell cycle sensor histidine kinase and response regulator CckA